MSASRTNNVSASVGLFSLPQSVALMAYVSHPPSLLRTHAHNLPRPPLTFLPASPSRLKQCRPPRHRLALAKHTHLSFLNVHSLFSAYPSRSPLPPLPNYTAVGTCASIEPALLCSTQPEQVVTCLCLPSPDSRLHTPTRCLCPPG